VLGEFQSGLAGCGDIDGAELDRAGEERNPSLRQSKAVERDREDVGEVDIVVGHLPATIYFKRVTGQSGMPPGRVREIYIGHKGLF
jgi:hypothetical protein